MGDRGQDPRPASGAIGRLAAAAGNFRRSRGAVTGTPQTERRDPARALDFLRPAELAGDGSGPSEGLVRMLDERERLRRSPQLADRLRGTSWYHTIELPGGLVTPGYYDHRDLVSGYGFPESMTGVRALDVATFDGFWAFEMERRGATVTALDLSNSLEIDIPPQARALAVREGLGVPVGTGFVIAAESLGSRVDRREGTVYELGPDDWGSYDYVHVGDLLLHLERPLEALRRIRSVTAGILHLSDTYDPSLPRQAVRYLGGWSDAIWWMPGLDTLCQWIADAGFEDMEVLRTYQLDVRTTGATGYWRAVVQARG